MADLPALPAGWQVVRHESGHDYYWNTGSGEVSWERPQPTSLPMPPPLPEMAVNTLGFMQMRAPPADDGATREGNPWESIGRAPTQAYGSAPAGLPRLTGYRR